MITALCNGVSAKVAIFNQLPRIDKDIYMLFAMCSENANFEHVDIGLYKITDILNSYGSVKLTF